MAYVGLVDLCFTAGFESHCTHVLVLEEIHLNEKCQHLNIIYIINIIPVILQVYCKYYTCNIIPYFLFDIRLMFVVVALTQLSYKSLYMPNVICV